MSVTKTKNPTVPNFSVVINDAPLSADAQAHIVGITVENDVALPGMFELWIVGSGGTNEQTSWIDDEDLFAVGNVVEIKMGYAKSMESLIIGEITGLEPEFTAEAYPSLTVRGYDRRHRLLRGRHTRTFVQQKDSDIASQIASEAGLTADVVDSEVVHDHVFQVNQTDLEFLQGRAGRMHYEVVVDDKTLAFRPVQNAEGEVLTLTMEDDLLECYPRLSTMHQVSGVEVRGWSPADKKEVVGQAAVGDEASAMGGASTGADSVESAFGSAIALIGDHPVMNQAEADQMARARFNGLVLSFITGHGVCRGRSDLKAGTVIMIEKLGTRFSGHYYVTSVRHRYTTRQAFQTFFTFRRSAA